MTSGSKSWTSRTPTPVGWKVIDRYGNVTYQHVSVPGPGVDFTKTWSGTDQAVTPRPAIHYMKPRGFTRWVRSPLDSRTPANSRRGEHPYTCTVTRATEGRQVVTTYEPAYVQGGPPNYQQIFTGFSVWEVRQEPLSPGLYNNFWSPVGASTSNDWNALINKLREEIEGSDWNVGVMSAEAAEAVHLIFQSANRFRRGLDAVRKGDISGITRAFGLSKGKRGLPTTKNAASFWLEVQYGWLPLLKDTKSAAEALAKIWNFPLVKTYRVRRGVDFTKYMVSHPFYPTTNYGYDRLQYIARLTEVNLPQLLGLYDPASVIWEKTPFSFIADWFIPIGSYLQNRALSQALSGTFIQTGSRRMRQIYTPKATVLDHKFQGTQAIVATELPSGTEMFWMDRSVSTSLSVPLPRLKNLGDVPTVRKCITSVSLLISRHGSKGLNG